MAPDAAAVVLAVELLPLDEVPPHAASNVLSPVTPATPAAPFRKSVREMRCSSSTRGTRGSGPEVTISSRLVAARGPVRCHRRPDKRELMCLLHAPSAQPA